MDLLGYVFPILSFLSYRVVAFCLGSVPITHAIGVYLHCPKYLRPWKYLTFPFTGGNRHIALQLVGWSLWGLSALVILPVYLSFLPVFLTKDLPKIPNTHVDVVSGAAAVISFIGEVFIIKAILAYDGSSRRSSHTFQLKVRQRPAVASAVVALLGVLLSGTGCLLLLLLEYMPDIPSRVLYCCLSLSCLLIAGSTTYGLGGFLRYGRLKSPAQGLGSSSSGQRGSTASAADAGSTSTTWQFYQPFAGGTAFVATQAVGWSAFAATIVLIALLLQQVVAGVAYCLRCWALGAGATMMVAQMLLALSLLTFRGRKAGHPLLRAASDTLRFGLEGGAAAAGADWVGQNLPIILMYLPVHTFFALWVLSFTFLPLKWAVSVWVGFLVPYYASTSRGNPQHTGCRQWPWLMHWFERNVESALNHWFGEAIVIMDDPNHVPAEAGAGAAAVTGEAATAAGATTAAGGTTAAARGEAAAVSGAMVAGAATEADGETGTTRSAADSAEVVEAAGAAMEEAGLGAAGAAASSVQEQDGQSSSDELQAGPDGSSGGGDVGEVLGQGPADFSQAGLCLGGTALSKDWEGEEVQGGGSCCSSTTDTSSSSTPSSLAAASAAATTIELNTISRNSSSNSRDTGGDGKGGPAAAVSGGGAAPAAAAAAAKEGRYVFGFQPHGLYPTGAGFLPWMPSFRSLFPGVHPVTLVASVLYIPPFIRDISCWAGFRQVTRATFSKALQERGSVILCPGGQAELIHTWRAFKSPPQREFCLYTRHKGFCRVAIEHGAALVPVLALGEMWQLRNLFEYPALQQYSYRKLGFPVPFVLAGRWGVTPFPRRVPLVYVVGQPIPCPPHEPGTPVPAEMVNDLHQRYYQALEDMWARHHHRHPYTQHAKLVMVGGQAHHH